ncbi:MAG TPA: bifunctional phosphoribosyl-AMP cyclohydrolase/phosphoribosyl-ATP diphosphatase HisIE [Nitrospiria bacterium]|nr:bifunctional phosphoribosyl-AMP cyclohydrolase/phosphoribosyl-ATP diphosphatase HisIE [Nitrospiria bacterium]
MSKSRRPKLKLDPQGLLPAIVQDANTGAVLMLAYMSPESLDRTLRTGSSYFWSRSRRSLWRKGAQSGHTQRVTAAALDCDRDTVLLQVEQKNGACHTGSYSCFFTPITPPAARSASSAASPIILAEPWRPLLDRVWAVVMGRKRRPKRYSYVSGLFAGGRDRILKKITEEAGELVIASKNGRAKEIVAETADLWFHTLVVLGYHDLAPQAVYDELARRFGQPPRPAATRTAKSKKRMAPGGVGRRGASPPARASAPARANR